MSRIYTAADQLIGKTPLMELTHIQKKYGLKARILAKLEYLNPTGSVKDRAARQMIDDGEAAGKITPGGTIIEPTSGNTGIGLSAVAAARGYRAVIVMPDTMSKERIALMKAYGAEVVLTPGKEGMKGAIQRAKELEREIPGAFLPDQFQNPANPKAHRLTTGPEIWEDTDGKVDVLAAAVGTGGTLSGTGAYLKEKNPNLRVLAVEPAASPVLSGGQPGPHRIQGIGAGFLPGTLDTEIYDEVLTVADEEAFRMGREIGALEGILVGISSGAALFGALAAAQRKENEGKTFVVILPDSGDRYLSTPGYFSQE